MTDNTTTIMNMTRLSDAIQNNYVSIRKTNNKNLRRLSESIKNDFVNIRETSHLTWGNTDEDPYDIANWEKWSSWDKCNDDKCNEPANDDKCNDDKCNEPANDDSDTADN